MKVKFLKLNQQPELMEFLEKEIKKRSAFASTDEFRIGVSGGSIAKNLIDVLHRIPPISLESFRIFLCDERFVPITDKYSNHGVYETALIPSTTLRASQIVGINTNLSLKECAQDYEEKILKEFHMKAGEIPQFDILFLGIGPDGHTCSLFPGHPALMEVDRLIAAVENSPKPPPERVTMTFPLINNAKCVMFVALGEDKAEIVKRIFVDKEELPAGMIKPLNDCYCVLDASSGKYIK